jgi:uroporphyrinogen decarboxylase
MVSKRDRLEAAISGELADRPPVALWRHFPVDDQDPAELATSTAAFQEAYDFDFVKVTPASSFCLKGWGAEDQWRGSSEGTRQYTRRVIQEPEDWTKLAELEAAETYLAAQLNCLQQLRQRLGPETPIIQTIFNPLAQAKNLAGQERLLNHLSQSTADVRQGLETITKTTIQFVQATASLAVDGIFYAIQHASTAYMTQAEYRELSLADDHAILEAASDLWLNVLHLHGGNLMFDLATEYPVQAVNWHSQTEGPSLQQAANRVKGAVCGGLRRQETLVLGQPGQVAKEAEAAFAATQGRGFILGAGCVTPIIAPASNLRAARQSVEDFA